MSSKTGGMAKKRDGADTTSKRNRDPSPKSRKKKKHSTKKKASVKKKTTSSKKTSSSDSSSSDSSSGNSSKSSKNSKDSKSNKSLEKQRHREEKILNEAILKRREAHAIDNAWWAARREAARDWGNDKSGGSRRCLIIGGLRCGARDLIQHLVTGAIHSNTTDANLEGLIISPHERMDPVLRNKYPKMRWCKFFGNEAIGYWRALNARGTPFFVLVTGGILGSHIDDELLEAIDNNRGTLIIHQTTTNMLDSVFTFDRILANADRKALYPLCQEFIPDMATWDRYAEALLCDDKLFIDIIREERRITTFRLKI
jgi:hypothetical protein